MVVSTFESDLQNIPVDLDPGVILLECKPKTSEKCKEVYWLSPPPLRPTLPWWSILEQGGRIASLASEPSLTWGQIWVSRGSLLEAAGLGHSLGAV